MTTDFQDVWHVFGASGSFAALIGLAAIVIGTTRNRSVRSGVGRFLLPPAAAIVAYSLFGHAFDFGDGRSWIGTTGFGSMRSGQEVVTGVVLSALVATGVLGGVAERATSLGHLWIGAVVGGFVGPLVGRSSRTGLLADVVVGGRKFTDSGGLGAMFLVLGVMGLVGALVVGPRLGKIGPSGAPRVLPHHSPAITVLGGLVVSLGVATAAASSVVDPGDAGTFLVVAFVGMSAGIIGVLLLDPLRAGGADAACLTRGAVAGTVATVPGLGVLSPFGALLVGFIAGVLTVAIELWLESARIDDPAGVFAMFGGSAVWGFMAVGLVGDTRGLDQLAAQLSGAVIVGAWAVIMAAAGFGLARALDVLRLSPEEELEGLSPSG